MYLLFSALLEISFIMFRPNRGKNTLKKNIKEAVKVNV